MNLLHVVLREFGGLWICDFTIVIDQPRNELDIGLDYVHQRRVAEAQRAFKALLCERGADRARRSADHSGGTPAAEAIIDKAPLARRLILKPKRADAWDPARLSREVREYATEFGIRRELRFNDLWGTKVTEMVWAGISVPDLAIRIGWKIQTAAKMLGVYAALNPGRATVVALPAPAQRDEFHPLSPAWRDRAGERMAGLVCTRSAAFSRPVTSLTSIRSAPSP